MKAFSSKRGLFLAANRTLLKSKEGGVSQERKGRGLGGCLQGNLEGVLIEPKRDLQGPFAVKKGPLFDENAFLTISWFRGW